MRERRLGQALGLLRRREVARVVVANAGQVQSRLRIGLLDRSIGGDLAVGEAGGVPQ